MVYIILLLVKYFKSSNKKLELPDINTDKLSYGFGFITVFIATCFIPVAEGAKASNLKKVLSILPEGMLDNVAAAAGKAEVLAGKVKNKAIALLDDIINFVNKSYAELKKFFDDLFRKIKDWLLKKKDAVKQEVSKILEKFNTKFVYNVLEEGVFRSKLARALAASYDNVSPLIKKLEERIAKYEFEHAAILKDGKVELINGSKPSEVSFNLRQSLKMRNAIVTHNHPSGGSLSAADIRMFLRQGIQELRVKCPDGSVFSLKDKGLKLTKKEIERIINKTSSYIESEYKLGRKISDKDILSRLEAEHLMKNLQNQYGKNIDYIHFR